jgi:hypothetical protein
MGRHPVARRNPLIRTRTGGKMDPSCDGMTNTDLINKFFSVWTSRKKAGFPSWLNFLQLSTPLGRNHSHSALF